MMVLRLGAFSDISLLLLLTVSKFNSFLISAFLSAARRIDDNDFFEGDLEGGVIRSCGDVEDPFGTGDSISGCASAGSARVCTGSMRGAGFGI
jgi:hypothetical protein